MGITLARQSKHRDAIEAYRQAIKWRPEYAEAYNNLGNALRNVGEFDESLQCYVKAIALRPNYADAHNNYGIALSELGRFRRGGDELHTLYRDATEPRRCPHEPRPDLAAQGGLRARMG